MKYYYYYHLQRISIPIKKKGKKSHPGTQCLTCVKCLFGIWGLRSLSAMDLAV